MTADLNNLVVEILHNRGDASHPDWSVGSGFFIGTNLVLTVLHNVDGRGELLVRIHGKEEHPAIVSLQGDKDMDLAVLEVPDVEVDIPPLRYGEVVRRAPAVVEQCWAIGFPHYKVLEHEPDKPKPPPSSAHVNGEIPTGEYLDQQLLTLKVRDSPRPQPQGSEWEGMSGAVVFSGDYIIVGVITEHRPLEGESALTVVPITALDRLPKAEATKWWKLLGVDRQALVRLPVQDILDRFDPREPQRLKMSKKLIEEAKRLSNSNRHEEAIAAFDQAIGLNPNDAVAYLYKGLALLALRRGREAIDAFDQAIRLDLTDAVAYLYKGLALRALALGRDEEAVAIFDQAIRLDRTVTVINEFSGPYHDLYPHKVSAYLGKGLALLALGRGREAIAAFDQAIDLDPTDAVAYLYKGCVLYNLNFYEEALTVFGQAVDRDPTVVIFALDRDFYPHGISAHLGKGLVLRALKRYEEAVAAFDQALRLDPDNAAVPLEKGSVLHNKLKRDEEALVALDQAVRLSPNNGLVSGYAYMLKGRALLALKRYEEAVAAFDQVLRIADSMATRARVDAAYSRHVRTLETNASEGKDEALLALKNNEEGHGSF